MRAAGWTTIVCCVVGILLCELLASTDLPRHNEIPWRKTAQGWERAVWLVALVPTGAPALHPVALALMQLALSIAALMAFPAHSRPAPRMARTSLGILVRKRPASATINGGGAA